MLSWAEGRKCTAEQLKKKRDDFVAEFGVDDEYKEEEGDEEEEEAAKPESEGKVDEAEDETAEPESEGDDEGESW